VVRTAPTVREGVRSRRRYLTTTVPRPLCHWDLHAAYSPEDAGREVCLKVGNAALAPAGESGGIALGVLGFIINSADDLLPRSC
jgi:hypothetical protein